MAIEKILFPTKFRELSFNSLEPLFVLKDAGLKEIVLCHIILREDVGFVPFGGYLKEEEEKLTEEARIRFNDWQESLTKKGIDSKVIIKVGEPVHEVLNIAEDEMVDLVVVGQKQRTGLEDFFAGTDTLQIVTRSRIPVLTSKYHVHYEIEGERHEKINDNIFELPMLITDWSEPSQRSVEFLTSLKGAVKKVIVFNDIDLKPSDAHEKDKVHALEEKYHRKLTDCCNMLKASGIDAEPHLGAGDIEEEVLRISRERHATMIITGTTGKGRLKELLHGSLSHEITKKSELPTLLVP